MRDLEQKIMSSLEKAFPGSVISLVDRLGDGAHWRLVIKAKEFSGLSTMEQHRLVYAALSEEMTTAIHALSLETHELS